MLAVSDKHFSVCKKKGKEIICKKIVLWKYCTSCLVWYVIRSSHIIQIFLRHKKLEKLPEKNRVEKKTNLCAFYLLSRNSRSTHKQSKGGGG